MQFCWEPLLCPPPAPLPSSSPPNSSLIVVVVVVAQPSLFCLLKFVEEEFEVRDVGRTQEPTVITGSSQPKSSSPALFQVWSLNQFYSVEFSQIKDQCEKSAFSVSPQSRFASALFKTVSWALRAQAQHT